MGKEWNWGGRSSKRGGGAETQIPSGCMCAVFQAFDFHPFHFSLNHQQPSFKSTSRTPDDPRVPKGAEAPRNSLESEDGTVSSISKEENFKIPKNIRIRTSGSTRSTGSLSDFSSEISASPGTKTPTLVARLMGLDLLPDAHSSSPSSSCLSPPNQQGHRPRQHIKIMKHRNSTGSDNIAIHSLPETPRMSSGRRSDVEHRLSLQINKENMVLGEDLEVPRLSFSKRKYDENNSRSPSHYARQIVKQVRESVSRKVGLDITNIVKSRDQGREEFVSQFKFKKPPKTSANESSPGKLSNPSHSPRLSRFIDTKHKPSTKPPPTAAKDQNTPSLLKPPSPPSVGNIEVRLSRASTKPHSLPEKEMQNQKSVPKCKETPHRKLSSRLNKPPQTSIRNKQEESFITRPLSATKANDIKTKSKKTHPLSTNLLPLKTGPSPQKQVCDDTTEEAKLSTRLFSCSRHAYEQEATQTLATRGTNIDEDKSQRTLNTTTGADDEGPEYQYISAILSRTGVYKATIPHLQFQWFSSTHPLDPFIFHRLEHYPTSDSFVSLSNKDKDCIFKQKHHVGLRCNRRLLFDLVDELLSEILTRPMCNRNQGVVLDTVWKRIRSFPRAKCEVLEDIDGLIEIEELREGEGRDWLVGEIERNIWETLVHETFTVMVGDEEGWVCT
ncbi:serine/arginine repetitive matrix protein 1 [Abrus precatorius]|uniref:Serine/arginine repetitive matrix protein 1 n=1 Tax=Abrus precatorius TaxID=3816 RepID=A0A8B8MC86_ABRPR|nr:serine/arginine repetitive matrix protein 1 [Abrus precatorius]